MLEEVIKSKILFLVHVSFINSLNKNFSDIKVDIFDIYKLLKLISYWNLRFHIY